MATNTGNQSGTDKYKISWLDSAKLPSRIHLSDDDSESTICGYILLENPIWKLTIVPTKIHGHKRYCKTCYRNIHKKSKIKWFRKCLQFDK